MFLKTQEAIPTGKMLDTQQHINIKIFCLTRDSAKERSLVAPNSDLRE